MITVIQLRRLLQQFAEQAKEQAPSDALIEQTVREIINLTTAGQRPIIRCDFD
jgi:hypothetical protein